MLLISNQDIYKVTNFIGSFEQYAQLFDEIFDKDNGELSQNQINIKTYFGTLFGGFSVILVDDSINSINNQYQKVIFPYQYPTPLPSPAPTNPTPYTIANFDSFRNYLNVVITYAVWTQKPSDSNIDIENSLSSNVRNNKFAEPYLFVLADAIKNL